MISDADIEAAFDWLNQNADKAAQARADRVYLEAYAKSLVAKLMKEHASLPVAAQQREALADPRYLTHLEGLQAAVHNDEKLRFLKEAKLAAIEAWRTASSNKRAHL